MTQQSKVEIGGTFTEIFKDVEDVHEIVNVADDVWKQGMMTLFMALGGGDFILEDYRGDSFEKKKNLN